mgnify:CR=1 FL=1
MGKSLPNIDKLASAAAFVFLAVVLVIGSTTPPASGAELSIYGALPWYFWALLIGAFLCGMGILVHQAFATRESHWWLVGLGIVMVSRVVLHSLPPLRGYFIPDRGDSIVHLGHISDILTEGRVGSGNFYPALHLLAATLREIGGFNTEALVSLVPGIFSTLYPLNMYVLASAVAHNRKQALLVTAFASPLILGHSQAALFPQMQSLFVVPLLLYLSHQREKEPLGQALSVIPLLLLGLFITFLHPLTSLFLALVLFTMGRSSVVHYQAGIVPSLTRSRGRADGYFYLGSIVFLTFFIWYFSFPRFTREITRVIDWLLYQSGGSLAGEYAGFLGQAELTTRQLIEAFLNRYGGIAVYWLLSFLAVVLVLRQIQSRRATLQVASFRYGVQWLVFLPVAIAFLFSSLSESEPYRLSRFPLMVGTVLIGLEAHNLLSASPYGLKVKGRLSRALFLAGLMFSLLLATSLSVFNVYDSPRVYATNAQVPEMEFRGIEWFTFHADPRTMVSSSNKDFIRKTQHFLLGAEGNPNYTGSGQIDEAFTPSHFGYDRNETVAETLGFADKYLLTPWMAELTNQGFPENVRAKTRRYMREDLAKLEVDRTAAKVYSNGEYEVWRVYGGK